MVLSDLAVRRPVLSTVMSLLIALVGLNAWRNLPVRELPDVDRPVVSVVTTYTGASPETVEATVTEPLEQAINGVDGIETITSTSSFGTSEIQVEFNVDRDVDIAATDVQTAVQQAVGELPEDAERPIVRKAGTGGGGALMWIYMQSTKYAAPELSDLADRIMRTRIQVVPGVARVIVGGQRRYAMRVWLDPEKMAQRRIDPLDIRQAITQANVLLPAGRVEADTRQFTVLADAQIADPEIFGDVVIRRDESGVIRFRDIGNVELGSDNYATITRWRGEASIGLGVFRQSKANELEVANKVRKLLPELQSNLPEGIDIGIAVDSSIFVRAALAEVWVTLGIAGLLVVAVNAFFLRSVSTTIIPSIAIPVSVIGTFFAMWTAGFSINLLTLLSLVLAIGLLVDDSIVVMENVYRRQEEYGESKMNAAIRGSREVGFAVLATTVSLIAVLIPLALLGGNTGRLFREFALTMVFSVSFSTFIALTLVPTMCSKFLTLSSQHGRIYNAIERVLNWSYAKYEGALDWSLRHRKAIGIFLVINVGATVSLYLVLPDTLVPIEDRGRILSVINAPTGSTLVYTERTLDKIEDMMAEIPEVEGYFSAIGLGVGGAAKTNRGIMFTRLVPWDKRERSQQEIVGSLFPKYMGLPGALAFPINLPSINTGSVSDVEFVITSSFAELGEFNDVVQKMLTRARQIPGLVNVDTDLKIDNPRLDILFERDRVADLGLSVRDIAAALQVMLAEGKISEFTMRNKTYDVIAAGIPKEVSVPEDISRIYLRVTNGEMVPLENLVRIKETVAPDELRRFALERAAKITGNLGRGGSLGGVLEQMYAIADEVLPPDYATDLAGASREFAQTGAAVLFTFAFAIVFIYLILSAQFENFIHPITILLAVPLALLGALGVLAIFHYGGILIQVLTYGLGWTWLPDANPEPYTINLYSQIGMILLIGLVTKNSILLVDFANQDRARGQGLLEAVKSAGKTRFRPILMTSVTSILGAVPLLIATGAGAESRRPIGAVVVGGLLFSTFFTLLVIPVFYVLIVQAAEKLGLRTIPPRIDLEVTAEAHGQRNEEAQSESGAKE